MTRDRSIQRRQRQREFTTRLPQHCCAQCSGLLYEEESECLDCGLPRPSDGWLALHAQHDPWLGRFLDGRYLVTKRVGEGASGTVYRGYSTSIHREFAIKVVEVRSDDTRARLAREIGVMGTLKNPHIVPFYEVMEVPGNIIVVMDFIHGQTLQDLVSNGALSQERVIALGIQIANGLHEAHGLGLVHRDLKPANIMVETLPAGDDFAHVLDFGIVKTMESGNTVGFVGTPMFSSPEQISGEPVDARSDIYSLGLVLYFAITGRLPFEASTVLGILQLQIGDDRPRVRDVVPECPAELDALIFELIARAPSQRPTSMADVVGRLERLRQHRHDNHASEAVSRSRQDIAQSVVRSRMLATQPLSDARDDSFPFGVQCGRGSRLFSAPAGSPIVVSGTRASVLNGQQLKAVLDVPQDTSCITHANDRWLVGTESGMVLVGDTNTLELDEPIAALCMDENAAQWLAATRQGALWHAKPRAQRQWELIGAARRSPRWRWTAREH
ncbi:MAG: serine/threonine-protein kinase [bacterium]